MRDEKKEEYLDDKTSLISVIVPIYNVELYLRQCLDSIIGQTYQNLEIILVDDGSTDNSGYICDAYASSDNRIKVIHKENSGVADARNVGLAASTGQYIGWVDPDDWIEPDMFEYLMSNMKQYSSDITVCGRAEQYSQRVKLRAWKGLELLNTEQALQQLIIDQQMGSYLWDKLWKKTLYDEIEFPTGRTFEDISVIHKLFERAGIILCLPEVKYNYRQRNDSIVGSKELIARINRYIADKQRYDDLSNNWPQFTRILEAKCIEATVDVWNSYYNSTRYQREVYSEKMKEMSNFSRKHWKSILGNMNWGIVGKLAVPLTQFTGGWAYIIVKFLYSVRSIKHREHETFCPKT